MQLRRSRIKKIDIYAPTETDGYVGKKITPELLGFVYADVVPLKETGKSENDGFGTYKTADLVLNHSAGVSLGDYADIDGSGPNYRVTEISRASDIVTAKVEHI